MPEMPPESRESGGRERPPGRTPDRTSFREDRVPGNAVSGQAGQDRGREGKTDSGQPPIDARRSKPGSGDREPERERGTPRAGERPRHDPGRERHPIDPGRREAARRGRRPGKREWRERGRASPGRGWRGRTGEIRRCQGGSIGTGEANSGRWVDLESGPARRAGPDGGPRREPAGCLDSGRATDADRGSIAWRRRREPGGRRPGRSPPRSRESPLLPEQGAPRRGSSRRESPRERRDRTRCCGGSPRGDGGGRDRRGRGRGCRGRRPPGPSTRAPHRGARVHGSGHRVPPPVARGEGAGRRGTDRGSCGGGVVDAGARPAEPGARGRRTSRSGRKRRAGSHPATGGASHLRRVAAG